ncbi:MAG: outer membrane protein [Verrucomicrobiota bacterium]|jgi:Skp family chaperone for outer membrane proteins
MKIATGSAVSLSRRINLEMKYKAMAVKLSLLFWTGFLVILSSLRAAPITGTVRLVAGDLATVTIDGGAMPPTGARAEFFFKITGLEDEISVASGSALGINHGNLMVKIENATGQVEVGHLVRFASPPSATEPGSSPVPTPSVQAATSPPSSPSPASSTTPALAPTPAPSGRDPSFAFVDMNRLFKDYSKTKEAEARINTTRSAAKAEYDQKAAEYKRLLAEINALNKKLESSKLGAASKTDIVTARDAKITRARAMEREINDWRTRREKEIADQMVQLREGIVAELTKLVKEMAGTTNIVIDQSGMSLNGVPVAVFSPPRGDMTAAASSALEAGQPGAPFAAVRDIAVVAVDMNQVFKSLHETKRAETKINDAKTAAKTEYDNRAAVYLKGLDEIKKLNQELELAGLSAGARTRKAKQRDAKISTLKKLESEINDFRKERERQLQEQALQLRNGLTKKITDAVGATLMSGGPALVLDENGKSQNGLPCVFISGIPDLSASIIATLNQTSSSAAAVSPISSTEVRAATFDAARAFKAMPEVQQAESEMVALRNSAQAELATADATARQAKEKEFEEARGKKLAPILAKLDARLRQIASAGGYNLVFESSGTSQNGLPILLTASGLPDLTDQVVESLKKAP